MTEDVRARIVDKAINNHLITHQELRRHGAIFTVYRWQPGADAGIRCRCRNQSLLLNSQTNHSTIQPITACSANVEAIPSDVSGHDDTPLLDFPQPDYPTLHPEIQVTSNDEPQVSSATAEERECEAFRRYFHREIKKLPSKAKPRAQKAVLQNAVLPKLASLYGGEETLVKSLLATEVVKKYQAQKLEEEQQKHVSEIQAALNEGRRQAVKKIEQEFELTAPLALEGTRQSKAGQRDLREVTAFESISAAKKRSEHHHYRNPVPEIALSSPALVRYLCEAVKSAGGG